MTKPNLVPKKIVRSDGVTTTVHVNPEKDNSKAARRAAGVNPKPAQQPTEASASKYLNLYITNISYDKETAVTDIHSDADYINVRDDGIAYGVVVDDAHLGVIFAGKREDGESDEDYEQRCREALGINWNYLMQPIIEKYDCTLVENSDTHSGIEFFVPYEGTIDGETLESSGARADTETNLKQFMEDYGTGELEKFLADHFGYLWVPTEPENPESKEGYWQEEEVPFELDYFVGNR
jgi:hypothetical protein